MANTITPATIQLVAAAQKMRAVVQEAASCFVERDDSVKMIGLALIAGEHALAAGLPGTAKSAMLRAIAKRITSSRHFEKLLTKFTTIEEVFGPMSIVALQNDKFERKTQGYAADAHTIFLDEVGKANSAVLNCNLTLMNERVFHNGTVIQPCPLVSLVGATNELLDSQELQALEDRFLLRDHVAYVSDGAFIAMLESEELAVTATIDIAELQALNAMVGTVAMPRDILDAVLKLRIDLRNEGFVPSDRRWKKSLRIMQASALYDGRTEVEKEDLEVLVNILWKLPEQIPMIAQKVLMASNPLKAQAIGIFDSAKETYDIIAKLMTGDKNELRTACAEANTKLQGNITELERIIAANPGADTTKVAALLDRVKEFNRITVKKGFGV